MFTNMAPSHKTFYRRRSVRGLDRLTQVDGITVTMGSNVYSPEETNIDRAKIHAESYRHRIRRFTNRLSAQSSR